MKISSFINEIENNYDYAIVNENDFDTLGLAGADIKNSFCTFVTEKKYIEMLSDNAVMVLAPEELRYPLIEMGIGVCIVKEPRISFFKLHNFLSDKEVYKRNERNSIIGKNCKISNLAAIAEKNVVIGDNVIIEEFVSIKENTIIGDNTIIRSGAVVGGEGFEEKRIDGRDIMSVKHCGGVILGSNVEIQQSSCIDKAIYPWDDTVIGDYSKIDNLVHVSHAVKIAESCLIAAGAVIGGRSLVGKKSWIGLNATIRNGIKLGEESRVNMGAVVTKDVESFESVSGNFAILHDKFIKEMKTKRI